MTFTEAALAVLESEGRAMHARELADKAVEMGLLSHVGKTPVQTMSAQLSSSVAKGKGNTPFARVRPGVFALESWAGKPPGPAKAKKLTSEPKPVVPTKKKTPARSKPDKPARPSRMDRPSRPPKPEMPGSSKKKTEKPALATPARQRRERPKRERSGAEKPKTEAAKPVAKNRQPVSASPPDLLADVADDAGNKRKRRRRKSRTGEVAAESQQPQQQSQQPQQQSQQPQQQSQQPQQQSQQAQQKSQPPQQKSQPPQPSRPAQPNKPKKHEENEPGIDVSRGDEEPAEMADRIENILRSKTRPLNPIDLATELGMKSPGSHMLVEALIVADGLEANRGGLRPRFIRHRNGFALAEREVGGEIIALERQIADARERLIQIAERQILRKIRTVSMTNLVQVLVVHLQRLGFGDMSPVKQGRKDEFHLSMQDRRRGGRFRTAVVLKSDPPEKHLDARSVMDLRGALHHYDSMSGMIITTGSVSEAARKEGRVPNLPPVAIMDGEMLARDLARLGIGVRERLVSLPAFDDKFFSSLDN